MAKEAPARQGDRCEPPGAKWGATCGRCRLVGHLVAQPHGGAIVNNVPGSNGGVHRRMHRGLDLKPRNVVQAVIMKAFIDDGMVVTGDGTGNRASWRKRKKQRHTLVHNEDAAAGDQAAYGPSIRALGLMHEVLQPGKGESPVGGPFMHRFARALRQVPTPPAETSLADEPGSVVDRSGKLYVDGDA